MDAGSVLALRVPLGIGICLICGGGIVVAAELIADVGQVLVVLYVVQFTVGIIVGTGAVITGVIHKSKEKTVTSPVGKLSGIDGICRDDGLVGLDLESPTSGSNTATNLTRSTSLRSDSTDLSSTLNPLGTPISEETMGNTNNNATASTIASSSFLRSASLSETPTSASISPKDVSNPLQRGVTPSRMWVRRSTMTWDSTTGGLLGLGQSGAQSPGPESSISGTSEPQSMTRTSLTKGVVASTYRAKRLGSLAAVLKCAAEENALANLQVSSMMSTSFSGDEKNSDLPASAQTVKEPEDLETLLKHGDYETPAMPTLVLFGLSFKDAAIEQTFRESYISRTTFLLLHVATFWVSLFLAIYVAVADNHAADFRLAYYCTPLPSVVIGGFLSLHVSCMTQQHVIQFCVIAMFLLSNIIHESHMALDNDSLSVQGPAIYSCIIITCVTVVAQPMFLWGALSVCCTILHVIIITIVFHTKLLDTQWSAIDSLTLVISVSLCSITCIGFLYKFESNKRWAHASCRLLFDTVSQCREEQRRTIKLIQNCLPKRLTDTILTTSAPVGFRSVWFDVCSQCHYGVVVTTDLVNFTSICSEMPAAQVISMLNKLYTNCDYYAEKYSVEKVKTLGDAWIAAVHPARTTEDYCNAASLAMQISQVSRSLDAALSMRVGIGNGILLATMAGRVRAQYEVLGEALTEAVQMESTGIPGMVQVSDGVANRLRNFFSFEKHEVKVPGSGIFLLRKTSLTQASRRVTTITKNVSNCLIKPLPAPKTSTPNERSLLERILRDPPRGEPDSDPFRRKLGGAMMAVNRFTFLSLDGCLRDRLFQGQRSDLLSDGFSFLSAVDEKHYRQFVKSPLTSSVLPYAILVVLSTSLSGGLLVIESIDSISFSCPLFVVGPLIVGSLIGKGSDEQVGPVSYFITILSVFIALGIVCAAFSETSLATGYTTVVFMQLLVLSAFHPMMTLQCKLSAITAGCVSSVLLLLIRGDDEHGNDLSTLIPSIIAGGFLASYASVITERTLRRTWEDHQRISQEQQAVDASTTAAENTLLNAVPAEVLHAVGRGDTEVVHDVEMATVGFLLFDDIIGVTETTSPSNVVFELNTFLGAIDELLGSYPQIVKLKNIPYIVVSGCPNPTPDHASSVVGFAHEAMKVVRKFNKENNRTIKARGGIQCGKLSAGLLGTSNFVYDIFGDCVNTASRLSSNAPPFGVLVSANVVEVVSEECEFETFGNIHLKGKGKTMCFVKKQSEPEIMGVSINEQPTE